MSKAIFNFYADRIAQAPKYGFRSGHEILSVVGRTALNDSCLSLSEFDEIMHLMEAAHIKMMEDNYNEGWQ